MGEAYLGRPVSVGRSLRVAVSMAVPFVGTMLLFYLGLLAGPLVGGVAGVVLRRPLLAIAAAIIPVVYLFLAWLLVWPVMVLERRFGVAALSRSRALMRGNKLRGFGVTLVAWLIIGVVGTVLQLALGYIPVVGSVAAGLAAAVGSAYGCAVAVVLYFDIRCRKEAFDLEHLSRLVETAPAGAVRA